MTLKERLYQIVFESDTKAGKLFDVVLLWSILLSVAVVVLESVEQIHDLFSTGFYLIEWGLTALFTTEYILRIWISPSRTKYLFSFWGIIDLFSILPTYLSFFFVGYHYLLVVRIFRLLRVFRVLKLVRFNKEANTLIKALRSSMYKITIFLMAVITIVILLGTIMYVVEGKENGFTSIPQSIYWAIITITTVGYGDIVPHTVVGKFVSAFAMIIGYAILAVPTGIVTVAMSNTRLNNLECPNCGYANKYNANFCSKCGHQFIKE